MDPKAVALADQLDKLDSDLAQTEQDILSRLRAPLERGNTAADLAKRLKEQEVSELEEWPTNQHIFNIFKNRLIFSFYPVNLVSSV